MKIKQDIKLHNKHHLVLTDKNGKVKQEGWAYNIILDQGFTNLMKHLIGGTSVQALRLCFSYFHGATVGTQSGWLGMTFLGSDDGTILPLVVGNTVMGGYLGRKINSFYSNDWDMAAGTAEHTRVATWTDLELQEVTIKEVGLGTDNETAGLATRAFIEDSEGNPISIVKGLTDALSVYSTLYIEISHAYGANLKFIEGTTANGLLNWIVNNSHFYTNWLRWSLGRNKDVVLISDPPVKTIIGSTTAVLAGEWIRNAAGKKITYQIRVGTGVGNHAKGIWEVGFDIFTMASERTDYYSATSGYLPMVRTLLPLTGVWDGDTINENIGTGDGTETIFGPVTWLPIVAASYTVKVNDVTQTETTDYTISTTTGVVTFEAGSIPPDTEAVTIEYDIDQIPKDGNHILAVDFELVFADGG